MPRAHSEHAISTSEAGWHPLLDEARTLTDAGLAACAERLSHEHPGPLGEAIGYALATGGKRVRPALLIAAYRALGGTNPEVAGLGVSVEIVHTYSLVHDDLPCIDDDDHRRGRPTTHRVFDVETAIRAGWLLVPAALEELAAGADALGLAPAVTREMAARLLRASGMSGMIGGQWLDLEAEGRSLDMSAVDRIHHGKTGALITAACVVGGMAAAASPTSISALDDYGEAVGLAFQITDDILDATATQAELGKVTGRDALLEKSTYVSLLGVTGAREAALEAHRRAMSVVESFGASGRDLAALADYVLRRSLPAS